MVHPHTFVILGIKFR